MSSLCPASTLSLELFHHLTYFGPSTRHRHLFLGSCPVTSLPNVLQAQHFLVSEGANWGHRPGHFLVPSATSEPNLLPKHTATSEAQLRQRDILFWLAQTPNNAVRYEVQRQLIKFGKLEVEGSSKAKLTGSIQVYGDLERGNSSYGRPGMKKCIAEMQRAVFCPALPAENTAGLIRFFDALRSGCIPVVVTFKTDWGSGVSWWRQNGPPVEWSLPFAWELNWRQLVVEVPDTFLSSPGFVETCLQLSDEEISMKQRHIARVRNHLGYDFEGGRRDAFSLLMDGIRSALPRLGPHPFSAQQQPLHTPPSPQICDRTPRSAQHRLLFPFGSEIREKAWSHSFAEVSCLPVHMWHPPGFFLRGQQSYVVLEHYVTLGMQKQGLYAPAFWLRAVEGYSVPGEQAHMTLSKALMASCRHINFPVACHDVLVQGQDHFDVNYCFEESDDSTETSSTSTQSLETACRIIPWSMPASPALDQRRWEIITWGCGVGDDFASVVADLQRSSSLKVLGDKVALDVFLYDLCGASGARATLHHVQSILWAHQRGTANHGTGPDGPNGPDGIIAVNGDRFHSHTKLADAIRAVAEHVFNVFGASGTWSPKSTSSQSIGDSTDSRTESEQLLQLLLFEGPVRSRAVCSGFCESFSYVCPIPSKPMQHSIDAVAFTTTGLSLDSSEWDVASTMHLGSADDTFNLLAALLLKVVQDANESDDVVSWDSGTLAEDDDLLSWCESVFLQNFVELSGVALAEGNQQLFIQAQACLQAGGEYAVVETGIPHCLDTPQQNGWSKKEHGNLLQMLGKVSDSQFSIFEALGVCFPEACRSHAPSLAWQYLFEWMVHHWNCAALPPVPPSAALRLHISSMDELDRLLGPSAADR